jgi:pimeloyl-ACP methyl ester carboxylesterase
MRSMCITVLAVLTLFSGCDAAGQTPSTDGRSEPTPADTETIRQFRVKSDLLSQFWGRPIYVEAGVIEPDDRRPEEQLPVCFRVNGFSGSHRSAWIYGPQLVRQMAEHDYPRMLYVFLNAACPQGHHVFADSVNNGPWGTALVSEFIPALESEFNAVGVSEGRFLTGHSSGGWSAAWLQIRHPDYFNGSWATAPDPLDFRAFMGIDLYHHQNVFSDDSGAEIPVYREDGTWRYTWREVIEHEDQGRHYGGQFASFDYTFSPRRDDGLPQRLFNHETGEINKDVVERWKRYDISLILRSNWERLESRLQGKLHFYCGLDDNIRLEESVILLQRELGSLGSDAEFVLVAGRDHRSLYDSHPVHWPYQGGMLERIHREMRARWDETVEGK